jgi:hypothetical protein
MMKMTCGVLLFLSATVCAEAAYAQLSSIKSQVPSSPRPTPVVMDSVDVLDEFELSPKRDSLIAKTAGVYFVVASGQCASVNKTDVGNIDMWFVKNSEAVPNSNSRMSIDNPISVSILVTQFLVPLAAGDTIGTHFSASAPSLGFLFSKPDNEPANTSFLFSIFKVD